MAPLKIYVDGEDSLGWSIDQDRQHIKKIISNIPMDITRHWWMADIVHNIWWNQLSNRKNILKRYFSKNLLVTCSNFIDPHHPDFEPNLKAFHQISKCAKGWICPSKKQLLILEGLNMRAYWQPFFIDIAAFSPSPETKETLCKKFDIPYSVVKNKIIIGSFQRDSRGDDLSKGKWHKNPDLLIDILKAQDPSKYILLLAGPRRHYLRSKCKEFSIPYYFIGEEIEADDLTQNALPYEKMPDLYNLIDLYLITSASEGGPKAVMEAPATKTMIMSTDVGAAADFVHPDYVFEQNESGSRKYTEAVSDFINNGSSDKFLGIIDRQYTQAKDILNSGEMAKRLCNIYEDIL